MAKLTLNEQAKEILKIAEEHGVEQDFFFVTTFKRYQVQLNALNQIEKSMQESEQDLTQKDFINTRKKTKYHEALAEYNKTSESANRTVATLIKIIATLRNKTPKVEDDDLDALLQKGR